MLLYLPERIVINYITTFIRKMNFFYTYNGRKYPSFHLSAYNVKDIDILGVLLLYKFFEYSIKNECFDHPIVDYLEKIKTEIAEYGFGSLVSECFVDPKRMENEYKNLKPYVNNQKFLVSPITLYQGNKNRSQIERNCFSLISSYYDDEKQADMVFIVLSELIGNFYSHSDDTNKSILVAYGDNHYIEIACADSGVGIVSTLRPFFPKKKETDILLQSIKKGISCKPKTDHMGNGLWMLDQIVRFNGGRLFLCSYNSIYERIGNKTSIIQGPTWRGSIIYVKLDVTKPVSMSSFFPNQINRVKFI